jgi:two-component system sensor histidine kinase CpxA
MKKKIRIKLFWKILLLFWLVFVIILTFNLFFTHLSSENIRYRPMPPHLHHQLKNVRHKLGFILKEHPNIRKRPRKFLKDIFLIDKNGKDYFNKQVPEMLALLDKRIRKNDIPMTAFKKQMLYFGGLPFEPKTGAYKIYVSQRFSVLSRGYFSVFIREFAHNLLASTFLVSFPLSFLLAWLFTRPIRQLQSAIKEMSENLSERKNLDFLLGRRDEFGDLARDFDSMAAHLDKILISKNRLLSDVSHELKSPLARLQIALGLAHKKQNNDSSELIRIKLEADRMNQMINGLLDYSKVDTQYKEQDKCSFDIRELIETLIEDAKFESQQKNIQIKSNLQAGLTIRAIKPMLISCIENILRNAIRYANKEIEICCHSEQSSEQIIIIISDDGIGVPDGQQGKIFDAFYRPEEDRSRQSGGVGLGLSIAKKAVDAHNGKIMAENIQPHGLRVSITLPCQTC